MRYEIKKNGELINRYISDASSHMCEKCFNSDSMSATPAKCGCFFICCQSQNKVHSFCFKCNEVKNMKAAKVLADFIVYEYNVATKLPKGPAESTDMSEYMSLLKISFHNSRTIVSNMKSKIFSLLCTNDEELAQENDKIGYIQRRIETNGYLAAREILSCLKSAEQILYEFASVDFLHPIQKTA